jgi:hypothetical protein
MEMLIHAFSNEASAKARFLNLGSNPNIPGIFSQLVSSFMRVAKCRVYFSVIY